MTERSRYGVLAAAALLLVGHLVAGVKHKEWWPLSDYGLYTHLYAWGDRTMYVAYGLTAGGERVRLDRETVMPLENQQLERLLKGVVFRETQTPRENAAGRVLGLAWLYEQNRVDGRHGGPPLERVRLVADVRALRADAANARGPADREAVVATWDVTDDRPAVDR